MTRLTDKIAIVTGGARGMGEATVRKFLDEGARVVIADLLPEGEQLARELGDRALFVKTDVSREEDWVALLDATIAAFGTPDVLVNNAAVQRFQSILECEVADYRKVIDINLIGTFIGLRIVGGAMVRNRRGSIVNVSSIDGMRGANGYAAYSTSKWGVRGLTKVAALEFGPRGVRVNSVHPGGVFTAMGNPTDNALDQVDTAFAMVPAQRIGQAHEIAAASAFLASDEASYVMGAELAVDGGWSAGFYNEMLSGSPSDSEYGSRAAPHGVSSFLDSAFTARSGGDA